MTKIDTGDARIVVYKLNLTGFEKDHVDHHLKEDFKERKHYEYIFKETGSNKMDKYRCQKKFESLDEKGGDFNKNHMFGEVVREVERLAKDVNQNYIVREWVILASFGGGGRQDLHFDIADARRRKSNKCGWKGSFLVALGYGAKLILDVDKNRVVTKMLEIPPYHVCFFRSDVEHAGAGYDSMNLRLHGNCTFASCEDEDRERNNNVVGAARRCVYCRKTKFKSTESCRVHMSNCKKKTVLVKAGTTNT